ncbi:MAG: Ser/Thr protein kinase RdoA (MazF antagonist), partial [Oleispira sp.]
MTSIEIPSLHPYQSLSPDAVIDAVESVGLLTDMRQYPLNSYENRVYQVGIEEESPVIVKFYRPNRWSKAAILEEHQFLAELAEEDLPVVAPLEFNGQTLFENKDFYFSISPRKSGHSPEIANCDQLEYLGRWLARMHQVGRDYNFQHRPIWNGQAELGKNQDKTIIEQSCETVLNSGLLNDDFRPAYES